MADFNMNTSDLRAEAFDAFVQLVVGSDKYRLKTIQQIPALYDFTDEERYIDDGSLFLARNGMNHEFDINLVLTADEFDTANPPTDTKTISYFLYQKYLGNRVQMNIVQVFLTKAQTNPFLRHSFTYDIQKFGTIRNVGGAVELTVSGRIINQVSSPPTMIRSAS